MIYLFIFLYTDDSDIWDPSGHIKCYSDKNGKTVYNEIISSN